MAPSTYPSASNDRVPRAPLLTALGMAAALAGSVASAGTTVVQNPGSGTNRIEVSGNTAQNVRTNCGAAARSQAAANVNSVNVEGAALKGKTVIVTGHNSRGAVPDCGPAAKQGADVNAGGAPGGTNVNSVNIR